MQTLTQARRRASSRGEPLYNPISAFKEHHIHIRRGEVSMIAAAPGGMKSMLTQAILHHGSGGQKNSTLYFSADSSAADMYERAGALAARMTIDTVRTRVQEGRTAEVDAAIMTRSSHIKYDFSESPSQEHVLSELEAYLELEGMYPEAVVMDNLKDLVDGMDENEARATEDAVVFLKSVARRTGAAVIALHHVGGEYEHGEALIPLSGIRMKATKTPALILTSHKPDENTMRISVVKNRGGKADPSGRFWVPLEIDPGRMSFKG